MCACYLGQRIFVRVGRDSRAREGGPGQQISRAQTNTQFLCAIRWARAPLSNCNLRPLTVSTQFADIALDEKLHALRVERRARRRGHRTEKVRAYKKTKEDKEKKKKKKNKYKV